MNFKPFIIFVYLTSPFLCFSFAEPPKAEDINAIISKADETVNRFCQDSFKVRMEYEFAGRFLIEDDRLEFLRLCDNASKTLDDIICKQRKMLDAIDSYQGADWEKRYGQNQLFRRLDYNYHKTLSDKCLVDSYRALASELARQSEIIQQVLDKAKKIKQISIAKAQALAVIAKLESKYKSLALTELNRFRLLSSVYQPVAAAIEEMKLSNKADPNEIQILIKTLEQNAFGRYRELFIELVILQRQYDIEGYEKTLNNHPEIKPFFCRLLSHSIINAPDFKINDFEAEMLADFTLAGNPEKHKAVLQILYEDKSVKSPSVLYAFAKSIEKQKPKETVELLLRTIELQKQTANPQLPISINEIAYQAALTACRMCRNDSNDIDFAAEVFGRYREIAGDNIDEDFEWQAGRLFLRISYKKADSILKDIQNRGSKYSKKASLYLAARQVRKKTYKDLGQRQKLLQQFADSLVDNNDCSFGREAYELTEDSLLQIELFSEDADVISNCLKIAEFINRCDSQMQTKLLFAEAILLSGKQTKRAEKLIAESLEACEFKSLGLVRCNARLNRQRGNFKEAALLWGQITNALESKGQTAKWRWWRAKYYQLYCAYKAGENPQGISHIIDVLTAGQADIPWSWAERLGQLQQNIAQK